MRELFLIAVCAGCVGLTRTPPRAEHVGAEPLEIDYPPPPARVEFVPAPESEEQYWIDGQWRWKGGRWTWQKGGWETAPSPDAAYAPPLMVRRANGELVYYEGRWVEQPVPAE